MKSAQSAVYDCAMFRTTIQAWKPLSEPRYATIIIIRLHRSWFRGTVVERLFLAGELSLSGAKHVADG